MAKSYLVDKLLTGDIIEYQHFRSREVKAGYAPGSIYGGQVVGQAVTVAWTTVPDDFYLHSYNATFLALGDHTKPFEWKVIFLRDGFTSCTRYLEAYQTKGIGNNATEEKILAVILNFCIAKEAPGTALIHQVTMPVVPPPESLRTARELFDEAIKAATTDMPPEKRELVIGNSNTYIPDFFDCRPVDTALFGMKNAPEAKYRCWIKCTEPLDEEQRTQHAVLSYVSDSMMLFTVVIRHQEERADAPGGAFTASMGHSLWIHEADFKLDDWLLYELESPKADHGRALIHAKFWTREGVLVASATQEGAVRLILKTPKRGRK